MGSLNRATVLGRLGKDAELKYTPGGAAVCSFSMATSESWKDKQGQKQERTEWHRIVLWGKVAEALSAYLLKGREVLIEGRLQTRQWEKDGQKHYSTEIVADKVVLVGKAPERNASREPGDDENYAKTWDQQGPVSDDDIPF